MLRLIKEAVEKIETFTKGFTFEEFAEDTKTVDAVIRNLEILGEAAKHIPIKRVIFKYSVAKIKTKLNEGEEHFNHYGQLRGV